VAKCIENGAAIINDISAGNLDDAMFEVTKYKVPYIVMHMRGTPQTMQSMSMKISSKKYCSIFQKR
jgi:dihydropteroate synthase